LQNNFCPAQVAAGVAALFIAFVSPAFALINPKFTPVDLIHDAEQVLELKLSAPVGERVTATITGTLKGTNSVPKLVIDWKKSKPEHAELFAKQLQDRDNQVPALFFRSGNKGDDDDASSSGLLHMDGVWVVLTVQPDGTWRLSEYDNAPMRGTWQGATDMLRRAIDYILTDPQADFPCADGVTLEGGTQFAKLDGKVNGCAAVDLAGNGTLALFVACDSGDRLFTYDAAGKKLQDVTASHAVMSKSKLFVWGDFCADGRVGLAVSDGKGVMVYRQDSEGKFSPHARWTPAGESNTIISLSTLGMGISGQVDVLVAYGARMAIWSPANTAAPPVVVSDGSCAKDLGQAGRCLVADFDGDRVPDILQCFEHGAVVCKGKTVGQFEKPRVINNLAAGSAPFDAFVGDFDADGQMDIITISSDACRIWQNHGVFQITEELMMSGEAGYKAAGGAVAGVTCDFNNDGRQDFVLFYNDQKLPQFFFNRGFRSFGFAPQIGEDLTKLLPQDSLPQQGGVVADLNGDGAQDLVVILNDGTCWWLPMSSGALAVHAALPLKTGYAGPVAVTGWHDKFCLGAWNITAGASEAFVAWKESGPVTLKWQYPDAGAQKKEVILEDKPVRVLLGP